MDEQQDLAEAVARAVRDACFRLAATRYEDASMSGLCHEGALEVALDAIRSLDVAPIVADFFQEREAGRTS
ncbi:MAG: acetyltransferase [Chloroflexi bacterium]|nr:acetyltransferase [Chloroflexota bacterium]